MSVEINVDFTEGRPTGTVEGLIAGGGGVGRWKVQSAVYTITAASVSPELETNYFQLDGFPVELRRALPDDNSIGQLFSEAVASIEGHDTPSTAVYMGRSAQGWSLYNLAPDPAVLEVPNEFSRVLWGLPRQKIEIPGNGVPLAVSPSPRLGAAALTLQIGANSIHLPLLGELGTPVLLQPQGTIPLEITAPVATATLSVHLLAVRSVQKITASQRLSMIISRAGD